MNNINFVISNGHDLNNCIMLLVTGKDLLSSTGDGSIKEKLADGMIFPSKKGRWWEREFLAPSKQATEVVAIHPSM